MFSLVQMDNENYYVVNTKSVKFEGKSNCVAKYKGCYYSAIHIAKSDDKIHLGKIEASLTANCKKMHMCKVVMNYISEIQIQQIAIRLSTKSTLTFSKYQQMFLASHSKFQNL
ncbi:uncharacterized protein LOC142232785 [Haematobia irritans]|uniref:uncharacterized protein LOC142232785 n=1 Tax=Haematobia irritans TaxID=7368 RepID=UPI003F4FDE4A